MCEKEFKRSKALEFLEDLRLSFSNYFPKSIIEKAITFSLQDSFQNTLKEKIDYYENINKEALNYHIKDRDSQLDMSITSGMPIEKIKLIVKKPNESIIFKTKDSFYDKQVSHKLSYL
jgi:hypothetical protein